MVKFLVKFYNLNHYKSIFFLEKIHENITLTQIIPYI